MPFRPHVGREGVLLPTNAELTRMLKAAGLLPIAYYGDWELNPFKFDSHHLIILSVKQEDA